jgi:hypothetical protein
MEEFIKYYNNLNEKDKNELSYLLWNGLTNIRLFLPDDLKTYDFYYNNLKKKLFDSIIQIPEKFRDYNMYKQAVSIIVNNNQFINLYDIPGEFLNEEMCLYALEHDVDRFEELPKKFLNYDFYKKAIANDSSIYNFLSLELKNDTNLIKIASKSKNNTYCSSFLVCVPDYKKTYKICLNASKNFENTDNIRHVPGKYINKKITFNFIKSNFKNYEIDSRNLRVVKKFIAYDLCIKTIKKNNLIYYLLGFVRLGWPYKYVHKKSLSYYTF